MPNFNNGDIVRVTCRLRAASGDDMLNVFHFVIESTSTIPTPTLIPTLNTWMNTMYAYIQPAIPSDVSFVDIDIMNVTQGEVYPAYAWPTLTVGGGTGDTMPEQACGLVVGRTSRTKTITRKFLGPIIESANNDGAWYSTLFTQLGQFMGSYIATLTVSAGNYVVPIAARYLAGVIDSWTPILSGYTSTGIYTQRRRRRGVGG